MHRTDSHRLTLAVAAGLLVVSNVAGQTEPIRNWAAPLYWQPSRQESTLVQQVRETQRAVQELAIVAEDSVSSPPLVFVATTPCRVMDTRVGQGQTGAFGPPALGVGETRTVPLPTHPACAVPSKAKAYSLNVTVVPSGPLGYITLYPTGAARPLVATLNALDGLIHNNAAIVPAGTSGSINIYATNATDVVVDINGYYEATNALAGLNAAFGSLALASVTSGTFDIAIGADAGFGITSGVANVAVGDTALYHTTSGSNNVAVGSAALSSTTTASNNTALGAGALSTNTTGAENIAVGYHAGVNLTTGNYNIDIGSPGATGESNTTRIGDSDQTRTFISGIRGVTTGAANAVAVVVDSNGQLGTVSSSRTVKRDIEDMGDTTGTIMGLRPVRFRYKAHGPDSPRQYGLVAEEVAEVAPDLVARNKAGEIETVYYDKVNAMLLNQVQTQQRVIQKLESRLAELESRVK